MMAKVRFESLSTCGLECGDCDEFGHSCDGCRESRGKPPWLDETGLEECPFHDCPVNLKGLEDCSGCPELPCDKYRDLRPPDLTDEEHETAIEMRVDNLREYKRSRKA
jgi:hypothetical protein